MLNCSQKLSPCIQEMKPGSNTTKFILIVVDEEAIRESLALILEEEGYHCISVPDGEVAVEQAFSRTFNLIIIDPFLSKRKGLKLLVELKMRQPHTPILILSSYYDVEMASYALNQGATQYFLKPIDFEQLITVVRQLLSEVPCR